MTRFDDCVDVFSNWQTWSSEKRGNLINDIPDRTGKTLGTTDPPRHTTARPANALATVPDLFTTVKKTSQWSHGWSRRRCGGTPRLRVSYVRRLPMMHGKTIPGGSQVLVHIGSANRDERQFPDPDRFDLDRLKRRHLGLGYSTQFCVGAPLGRQISRISFEELLSVSDLFEA